MFAKTLRSILNQSFQEYEVVITDDSPDNSVEALVQSMDFGKRLRFFRNKTHEARQKTGMRRSVWATGDYIKIMHHDDYFSFDYSLGHYVKTLDDRPDVGFAFSASRAENVTTKQSYNHCVDAEALKELARQPAATLFVGNIIGAPSATIYRRNFRSSTTQKCAI